MWVNLINLPKQQIKVKSPEVLLKTDYRSMKTKATSVTDFITTIYGKGLELLKTDYHSIEIKTGSVTDSITIIYSKGLNLY